MLTRLKDPVSSITHFIALVAAIPVIIVLIYLANIKATKAHVISFIIFGIALILLYGASSIYHAWKTEILHKIDHMMIFVLIAGTYTPVCLVILRGVLGIILLCVIWTMACLGILSKIFWMNAPRWISTSIYVVMGWMVVVIFYPLSNKIPAKGIALLALGGIIYTIGAIIYATKRPKLNFKLVGFHEIFHLFVIGGSCAHVIFMFSYAL